MLVFTFSARWFSDGYQWLPRSDCVQANNAASTFLYVLARDSANRACTNPSLFWGNVCGERPSTQRLLIMPTVGSAYKGKLEMAHLVMRFLLRTDRDFKAASLQPVFIE